jgi:hypothetical protein
MEEIDGSDSIIEGILDGTAGVGRPAPVSPDIRAANRQRDLDNSKRTVDAAAKKLKPAVDPLRPDLKSKSVQDLKKTMKDFGSDKKAPNKEDAKKASATVLNLSARDPQGASDMLSTMKNNPKLRAAVMSTPGMMDVQSAADTNLRAAGRDPNSTPTDSWRAIGQIAKSRDLSESLVRRILREEARKILVDEGNDADLEKYRHDPIYAAYMGRAPEPPSSPDRDDLPYDHDDDSDPVDSDPSIVDKHREEVESSIWAKFRDSKMVDFALDILGTGAGWAADAATAGTGGVGAPTYVIAAVPDLVNCARHADRGEKLDAAIYFLCALPIIGDTLGPVKIAMHALGDAREAVKIFEIIKNIRRLIKALKVTRAFKNAYKSIKSVMLKFFPGDNVKSSLDHADVILSGSDADVVKIMQDEGYDTTEIVAAAKSSKPKSAKPKSAKPKSTKSKGSQAASRPSRKKKDNLSEVLLRRVIMEEVSSNKNH